MMKLRSFAFATVLVLAGWLATPASAGGWWHLSPACDPDSVGSGVVTITDTITGNFFSFDVDYEVFAADNCANPKPVKGSYTYIYTVTFSSEGPIPGISLDELRVEIANAVYVVDAGYLTGGPGVAPSSVAVVTTPAKNVAATFAPGSLSVGDSSLPIYVVSPYQPGAGVVNLETSFLAGAGPALVPQALPQPCPCTTSYWQLRVVGWPFFLLDFPGAQLEQVKQRAVDISGGFFTSKTDLINSLLYPGLLDLKKKAKRELAAVLMNTAAGELFPANTKCRLFLGSELDEDGDGVADGTVSGEIGTIISEIQAGDLFSLLDALSMAAQINSGQDVLGMALFH